MTLNSHSTSPKIENTMPPQDPSVDFLSLPLKVRLRIYEYLLVCKPQIIPHFRPATNSPLTPSILRTCKQIHNEASRTLYSKNKFLISEPETDLKWFSQMGPRNIKLLNSIRIFPHAVYYITDKIFGSAKESRYWYMLLDHLAREATGLRNVYVYWDAEPTCGHFGAGKDLRFVRKLAKIQGLENMTINGFYGVHWPRYLEEHMGVAVREEENDFLRSVRKFQRGTETLVP